MNPPASIPMSPILRVAVPCAMAAIVIAVAFSPVQPTWRLLAIVAIPLIGAPLWCLYLARRVVSIWGQDRGRLRVRLANGDEADVAEIAYGLSHPRYTTVSLKLNDGRWVPMVLDETCITPSIHWAVRRLLLSHRRDAPA